MAATRISLSITPLLFVRIVNCDRICHVQQSYINLILSKIPGPVELLGVLF